MLNTAKKNFKKAVIIAAIAGSSACTTTHYGNISTNFNQTKEVPQDVRDNFCIDSVGAFGKGIAYYPDKADFTNPTIGKGVVDQTKCGSENNQPIEPNIPPQMIEAAMEYSLSSYGRYDKINKLQFEVRQMLHNFYHCRHVLLDNKTDSQSRTAHQYYRDSCVLFDWAKGEAKQNREFGRKFAAVLGNAFGKNGDQFHHNDDRSHSSKQINTNSCKYSGQVMGRNGCYFK